MTVGDRLPPPVETVIYDAPGLESIGNGTLAGVQTFSCRLLVNRPTREPHLSPEAIGYDEYLRLVGDTVEALAAQGLRTAIYCGISNNADEVAATLSRRRVATESGGIRSLHVDAIGKYPQSEKENTAAINGFNAGRSDVLVGSRLFHSTTDIWPDVLIIAARVQNRPKLEELIVNFAHADPARPVLTVFEFLEITSRASTRSLYALGEILGRPTIDQGGITGGYLGAMPDARSGIDLSILPEHLRTKFDEINGMAILAAVRLSKMTEGAGALSEGMRPLEEIIDRFMPALKDDPRNARIRLREAGIAYDFDYVEIEGGQERIVCFSWAEAEAYFAEHPFPQLADPHLKTATDLLREHRIDRETMTRLLSVLGDLLEPLSRLHRETKRERTHYDLPSQAIIVNAIRQLKREQLAAAARTAQRRAATVQYELPNDGDRKISEIAKEAGVSTTHAAAHLHDLLVSRKPADGRPASYVEAANVEAAVLRLRRGTLSVQLISLQGIAAWTNRTTGGVGNRIENYPSQKLLLHGRGRPMVHYGWDAFGEAAKVFPPRNPPFPILWEDLPQSGSPSTIEQEYYARAIQILLMPPERLGDAAIMSRETALNFVLTAHEVATGQPAALTALNFVRAAEVAAGQPTVPQEIIMVEPEELEVATAESEEAPVPDPIWATDEEVAIIGQPAAPQEIVATEPEQHEATVAEAEATPVPSGPMRAADYAQRHNERFGGDTTAEEVIEAADAIGARLQYEGGELQLTEADRQALDAHVASLQPPPGDWVRIPAITTLIGDIGYESVRRYVDAVVTSGTGDFPLRPGSIRTARYLSPETARAVAKHFLTHRLGNPATTLNVAQIAVLADADDRSIAHHISGMELGADAEGEEYSGPTLRTILTSLGVGAGKIGAAQTVAPPVQRDARAAQRSTPASGKAPQALPPRLLINLPNPVDALTIAERAHLQPEVVRSAIARARSALGLKLFRSTQQRDRYEVLTEHFSDERTLAAIEDHLLGIHPHEIARRLRQSENAVTTYLLSQGHQPLDNGRFEVLALQDATEYFKSGSS